MALLILREFFRTKHFLDKQFPAKLRPFFGLVCDVFESNSCGFWSMFAVRVRQVNIGRKSIQAKKKCRAEMGNNTFALDPHLLTRSEEQCIFQPHRATLSNYSCHSLNVSQIAFSTSLALRSKMMVQSMFSANQLLLLNFAGDGFNNGGFATGHCDLVLTIEDPKLKHENCKSTR